MSGAVNGVKYTGNRKINYFEVGNLRLYDELLKGYSYENKNKSTNCPNCGAPITGCKCDYCGTDFEASAMWGMAM